MLTVESREPAWYQRSSAMANFGLALCPERKAVVISMAVIHMARRNSVSNRALSLIATMG
jgi:hypothetical protein